MPSLSYMVYERGRIDQQIRDLALKTHWLWNFVKVKRICGFKNLLGLQTCLTFRPRFHILLRSSDCGLHPGQSLVGLSAREFTDWVKTFYGLGYSDYSLLNRSSPDNVINGPLLTLCLPLFLLPLAMVTALCDFLRN